jgi:1A family penicillin-binding protein
MDRLFILLHKIVLLVIYIGDIVRYIWKLLITPIFRSYNYIRNAGIGIMQQISGRPTPKKHAKTDKKPVQDRNRNVVIWHYRRISRTGEIISRLPEVYFESFRKALAFFIPRLPVIRIRKPVFTFPRKQKSLRRNNTGIFLHISRYFSSSKPTPAKPYTFYPAPLKIALQIKAFFAGVVITVVTVFLPFTAVQWLKALPSPQLLTKRDIEVTTKIFDRHGELLYEIYADQNRTPIPLEDIPLHVQQATIAIEDKDFYRHQGFSVKGIARASREIFFNHRVQGGSTISQQLIKSALLTPEITISRKIKELVLASWAERIYSKDQILEMYLNQVPYGGTAWGIESASRTYFGKSVTNLSLAEAALLAGLPAAPTEYSPFGSKPQLAIERQKEVLRRMVEDRYISRQQADEALAEKLAFVSPRIGIRAPHFVMYVKSMLENKYGTRLVERGGLRVYTTLDVNIQEKAESIVNNQINSLAHMRVGNGAALVTDPSTGEILAMVGSKNYFDLQNDGNVNVTTSLRQPGSSIKIVPYAAALERDFTAATIIQDTPVAYRVAGSPAYVPVNYDGRFHGPTPLRYALANSYNIPAVKILDKIGVKTMLDKARLMGIRSWKDEGRYGLSMALGAGEVTMLEMAEVYGTLANTGIRVDLIPILEVSDYTGKTIEKNQPKPGVAAVMPEVAWILSDILNDNFARTPAFGPSSNLIIKDRTASVKTGTSNDKRDNWTIGYTPSYVVTVWVGNNDNSPMHPVLTSGVTGASPIWNEIMTEILKDKPDEIPLKPDTVITIPCYFGRTEFFIRGTEPPGGKCPPQALASPSGTLVR